jgi:hypothetical protein
MVFAYGCTTKTEISCRNAMLYYEIIKLLASGCYLRIIEYHGVFMPLFGCSVQTILCGTLFCSLYKIILCVYVILVFSEHNLHVPCLKTVGLNIDYYHMKLYSIRESERLLFHSFFQLPPGGKPIEMRYASCFCLVVFSYRVPRDHKNLFVLPFLFG